MMPVTKEPHRSSDTSGTTVSPIDVVIDAVRYAHRHPTFRDFGDPWQRAQHHWVTMYASRVQS